MNEFKIMFCTHNSCKWYSKLIGAESYGQAWEIGEGAVTHPDDIVYSVERTGFEYKPLDNTSQ